MKTFVVVVALLATLIVTPSARAQVDQAAESATVWLCRPGLADNPCDLSRTATVLKANGTETVQKAKPAKKPPIDCFYVYPTVSGQQTTNANLDIDPELIAVAQTQASRFSDVCRVFAPVYPQLTVAAIRNGAVADPAARAIAYGGVLSAWEDYLANFNDERGVVLIGHSQGAGLLAVLARQEIDADDALRHQLVSALLIGSTVTVAAGQDVGGTFDTIRACSAGAQTGCVVAYSTFDAPPPADSRFGRTAAAGQEVLCVNPADPADGAVAAPLRPYFRTEPFPGPVGRDAPSPYDDVSTPWATLPKLYTAECAQADGASWLQVNRLTAPDDDRPQVQNVLGPTWGLHLVDVSLTLGNLVDLVRAQSQAFRA